MSGCGAEQGLITVDQALAKVIASVKSLPSEVLPLKSALNRYLAKDIFSATELPLFSQSAVDGYAICTSHSVKQDEYFELTREIRAGQVVNVALKQGQAVRIFTGGKIPHGTTTVARQEIVKCNGQTQIQLIQELNLDVDIRHRGEEIELGQCVANQGQRLHVGAIAALSMLGIEQVEVRAYPKVAVIITGDEITTSIAELQAGQVFDANGPMLRAWFADRQQTVEVFHVTDEKEQVKATIAQLAQDYDVIFTTGGVSVGDYDFIRPVSLELGFEQIFWKVKQKPGKPMLFAKLARNQQLPCYLMGLPGNPAAVYVGMQIYGATLLDALQGHKQSINWFTARLTHPIKADQRERFLRMQMMTVHGEIRVSSLAKQQSHMLSNLMQANCLVRIPAGMTLDAGTCVQGVMIS
ncbi:MULTISPECIES: molybdopterin molybdotransferase MoeA [Acinetobacter]|uniref:molybdopterin molybdotransferase MoeA n=1 Tax=Acinetobacter TaxID=469 RepID=UPI000E341EFE|nr:MULTISPECIES: molybdopterin molybdotransferase MoeA [Acinetobacter]RFS26120.1 molybdopterin molybdenumtransferase MoeA [Acinetobacter sp. SWAC5]RKG39951.1 molybdopterin molybdenumtransferase MoeA [Acinetobacter cumulans]RZG56426.1 molybdopterin molybdenumtransferase MoeA [Acinetobacter sp. WCHAc060006]